MEVIDGQDVNMLNYFKQNKIPHTYQCSECGSWMGGETLNHPHKWVIRDLRPFEKVKDETQNETSHRDDSIS